MSEFHKNASKLAAEPTFTKRTRSTSDSRPGSRELWIDCVRACGAVAIVALHATVREKVYRGWIGMPAYEWWTLALYEALTRIAVPLFLMLSGYLIIKKVMKVSNNKPVFFRALQFFLIGLFWTLFYSQWEAFKGNNATARGFFLSLAEGRPYYHLWFLFAIAGAYVASPVLASVLRRRSRSKLLIIGVVAAALPSLYFLLTGSASLRVSYVPKLLLLPIPYLGYFVAGYCLSTTKVYSVNFRSLALIYTLALIASLTQYGFLASYGVERSDHLSFNPSSPFIVIMALAAFLLLMQIKEATQKLKILISFIAVRSMGVYIVHPIFLDGFNGLGFKGRQPNAALGILTLTVLVTVASLAATEVMRRIPVIRQTIS